MSRQTWTGLYCLSSDISLKVVEGPDKLCLMPNFGILPNYLNEHIVINNNIHSWNTRYSNFNVLCPKYKRETDGGRTFSVSSTKLWNSLTLEDRKAHSLKSFKKNMWSKIFKEQKFLQHFSA